MDSDILVAGGVEALQRIVVALEDEGFRIQGAYLITVSSEEGSEHRSFRVVSDADPREIIYKYVRLRREGLVPRLPEDIAFSPVSPNHVEAARVLDYAAQMGTPTVHIKGAFWKGLFIEGAVVVKWTAVQHATV